MDLTQHPEISPFPETVNLPVVTISRQLGSRGNEVAEIAAQLLGFRCVSREVINQAARKANAPQAALAAIDELGLLDACPSPKECRAYHEAVRGVIIELAEQGNIIIVGRASQVILHDRPQTIHVRIIAPLEDRVRRLTALHKISPSAALAQIETSDRYHHHYLRRYYHARWEDPQLYDLVINTGRVSPEDAAFLIQQAVQHLHLSIKSATRRTSQP